MSDQDLAKAFGALVRELRTARNFTQEAFADHIDIHRTYQSLIERGLRMPTIFTAYKIADGLNISITEFFNLKVM